MTRSLKWGLLAAAVVIPRLAHRGILWVEESYPAAAAIQMMHGLVPYRDFFFDKPPGAILAYLTWGAWPGPVQRLAGGCFVLLCCWLAYRFADDLWGEREAWMAAALMGFHLTFWVPSAVIALAPDLLMLAPHLAAVWLASRGRWLAAGILSAIAMTIHVKGVFVAAACLLWAPLSIIGATAGTALLLTPGYWDQVWLWGMQYSGDTFVGNPLKEGIARTFNWIGFHAAAVAGTAAYFTWGKPGQRWKMALWMILCLAGIASGARFFPRYYFLVLPCVVLLGARGLCLMPRRWMMPAALALLIIPLIRYGPRYLDLAVNGSQTWVDTAMNRDSLDVSRRIREQAAPGDTILVWGYRPDIIVYTRMKLGAPFLDSQPLTGVLADRHLAESTPTASLLAAGNRARLSRLRPNWVIDGLGPYNGNLAITNYPDLADWLANYDVAFRTAGSVAYRLRTAR